MTASRPPATAGPRAALPIDRSDRAADAPGDGDRDLAVTAAGSGVAVAGSAAGGATGDAVAGELTLDVDAVAHGGHCVARAPDGRVVFVRHALPGERVVAEVTEERRTYLRADTRRVLVASPDRVSPPCPWAGRCGGCDFQHVAPAAQRDLKTAVVVEHLRRTGGLSAAAIDALRVQVEPLPGGPLRWRTRVRYHVDATGRAGLLAHRSYEVVPVDRCRIAHPAVAAAGVTAGHWPDDDHLVVIAADPAMSAGEPGTGDGPALPPPAGLAPSAGEPAVPVPGGTADGPAADTVPGAAGGGVARGGAVVIGSSSGALSGPAAVRRRALGRTWTLPAGFPDGPAFWQGHPAAADVLAGAVLEFAAPRSGDLAWDLYAGAGLFAAALAPRVRAVTLVESAPAALAAARASLADLTNVHIVRSTVERFRSRQRPDLVVLDPPRSGAGRAVVRRVAAARPRTVVYVACDPAAFARDVATFRANGFRLVALRAVDAFPMTHHIELVGRFTPAH